MKDLKDLKAKILDDIPLSQIVSQYIPISQKGSAKMAVCPFHDDHNPSMSVSDEKKIFKCFSCGEYGNAIDFVLKYKNLDFIESLKEICDRNGIDFDEYFQKKKKDPKVEMAHRLLNRTTSLYRKMASHPEYQEFRNFLTQRGLSEPVAQTFQLGFAPKENRVTNYLKSIPSQADRELALKVAEEISLIRKNSPATEKQCQQSHYDTFRERIIFPIWDHHGQIIGFTSRAIHDYQKAKYMNSRDSFVFNKSELLYGLHLAKDSIRQKDFVLVVEGNMDQITLYSKGFENTVAIMGTAFGKYHLNILRGLTKNIYLAFDSDKAGFEGAQRANSLCLSVGIFAKYIDFGQSKDADDFLKEHGRVAMQELIDEAPNFIDSELESLIPQQLPQVLDQKLSLLKKAFQSVSPLKEELSATERILSFASKIGLKSDSSVILKQYQDYLANPQAKVQYLTEDIGDIISIAQDDHRPSEKELKKLLSKPKPLTTGERLLLKLAVQHPELVTHNSFPALLDFLTSNEVKDYVGRLRTIIYEVEESEYPNVILALSRDVEVSKEMLEVINGGLASYAPTVLSDKVADRLIQDVTKRLQEEKLKLDREELLAQRELCQTQEQLNELLTKLSKLDKELSELKSRKIESAPKKGGH